MTPAAGQTPPPAAPRPPLRVRPHRSRCGLALASLLALAAPGTSAAAETASLPSAKAGRLEALSNAEREGLDPADYAVEAIERLAADPSPAAREEFQRRLNDAWRQYVSDLATGRTDPADADRDWHIPHTRDRAADPAADARPPAHSQYALLRDALNAYQGIEARGGWPLVAPGPELRLGLRDERVAMLRDRLRLTGDYDGEMQADPWFFDTGMDEGLRRFQARHGVPATGVLDERTQQAIDVTLEERIAQLKVVMERWRWLPPGFGRRYIWVNTANTMLRVMDDDRAVLEMRTIVGHVSRPTPSMASELRQVVFNPTWSVPRTIAVEDLLPQQQENGGYLAKHRIRVFAGSDSYEREIDPAEVAWQKLGPDNFPYRLRQDAGPGNSLGRIKLAMDNPFDIYLHDTPSRSLFGLSTRTLGSGCIRLEDAAALTTLVMAADRPWTEADTAARMGQARTETINLKQRLPIWIVYLTAWVGDDGTVHFRRDIYGRDARLLSALRPGRPGFSASLTAQ